MGNTTKIYKGKDLNFRGGENMRETFKYLKDNGYFKDKRNIILSGTYNGAIAALLW